MLLSNGLLNGFIKCARLGYFCKWVGVRKFYSAQQLETSSLPSKCHRYIKSKIRGRVTHVSLVGYFSSIIYFHMQDSFAIFSDSLLFFSASRFFFCKRRTWVNTHVVGSQSIWWKLRKTVFNVELSCRNVLSPVHGRAYFSYLRRSKGVHSKTLSSDNHGHFTKILEILQNYNISRYRVLFISLNHESHLFLIKMRIVLSNKVNRSFWALTSKSTEDDATLEKFENAALFL